MDIIKNDITTNSIDEKLKIYKKLYEEYLNKYIHSRNLNSAFSLKRQRCWNEISKMQHLKYFEEKCIENDIPKEFWNWVVESIHKIDSESGVYSD